MKTCTRHGTVASCLIAGSVNFPFTENLSDLPQMVKLCKQRTSERQQPDEQIPEPESPASEHATNPASERAINPASADASNTQTPASGQRTALTPASCSQSAMHSSTHGEVECCNQEVIVICRRGNDSQHIVQSLRSSGIASAVDLIGGLSAWSQQLDPSFPDY